MLKKIVAMVKRTPPSIIIPKTTDYRKLGLENTTEMFKHARDNQYAVGAYNFNNMEQLQAIADVTLDSNAPLILQVSKGARDYANGTLLRHMAAGIVEYIRGKGGLMPVVLHLDHGDDFETCKAVIDAGFSSVMIDLSHKPFEENVAVTKQVVDYAHPRNVSVEGELGVLKGIEDDVVAAASIYTDPNQVAEYVERTGVDSVALSIGTSHGAYKFKPSQCTQDPATGVFVPPRLRFDILEEVERLNPSINLVLHGASSVLKTYVDMINNNGGKLKDSVGIPEDQIRYAARKNVVKVNIDSDGRLVFTGQIRKTFADKPEEFDPRNYLGPARKALTEVIVEKNKTVLGSAGMGSRIGT